MKNNIKQYRLWAMLAALLALPVAFTGCSEDDPFEFDDNGKSAINSPSLSETEKTVSQLTFAWDKVDGATQYAYELRDPMEELVSGNVTTETTVSFTGLKDNTTYTLKVWAYTALNSDKKGSPVVTLQATTDKIVPLEAPEPTAEQANGVIVVSWPEVDHADEYRYTVYRLVGGEEKFYTSVVTTDCSAKFSNLELGDYRFEMFANSWSEAYTQSETVSITFQRAKEEIWRVTGTYQAVTGEVFTADLVYYDDNSYSIDKPYGEEGYSIDFSVDSETTAITVLNGSPSGDWYYLWVKSDRYLAVYPVEDYSSFTGNKAGGEVWFYTYCYDKDGNVLGADYDWFQWGNPGEESTWNVTGSFALSSDPSTTWEATMTANEDGTYTIKSWYGTEGYDLKFSVDADGNMSFDSYSGDDWYWYVPRDSETNISYIYKPDSDGSYAVLTGGKEGGDFYFYDAYLGYITYTWGATASGPTIDDLVGSYGETFSGQVAWSGAWEDASYADGEATIAKVDDTTIKLTGLFGSEEEMVGVVDMNAKTITFAAGQTFWEYYTLAGANTSNDALIATFDDDFTITFEGIGLWYNDYNYLYEAKSVMTKK
ncbi:MAG: hypothetical protein ACI4C3_04755 [Bacteroides sp.]